MIETFRYRTTIKRKEFHHTIHSETIELSLEKWVVRLEDFEGQVYSLNSRVVKQIRCEFENNRIILNSLDNPNYLKYFLNRNIQITYIDRVEKGQPDFIATIEFLKTEEGGKQTPVFSGYRPQFQVEWKMMTTSAELLFIGKDKVFPGETAIAEIRILSVNAFEGLLYEGLKFKLAEGNRIIAECVIIEVINESLKGISNL